MLRKPSPQMSRQALGAAHSSWNAAGKLRQPWRTCQSLAESSLSCEVPRTLLSKAPSSVSLLQAGLVVCLWSLFLPIPCTGTQANKAPLTGPPGVSFLEDPDRWAVVQTLNFKALWRCTEPPSTSRNKLGEERISIFNKTGFSQASQQTLETECPPRAQNLSV